jgi:hypothetical protein
MINKIYLTHCICLYLDTEFTQISGLLSILHIFTYLRGKQGFVPRMHTRSPVCHSLCQYVRAVYVKVLVLPRLPAQKILSLF